MRQCEISAKQRGSGAPGWHVAVIGEGMLVLVAAAGESSAARSTEGIQLVDEDYGVRFARARSNISTNLESNVEKNGISPSPATAFASSIAGAFETSPEDLFSSWNRTIKLRSSNITHSCMRRFWLNYAAKNSCIAPPRDVQTSSGPQDRIMQRIST